MGINLNRTNMSNEKSDMEANELQPNYSLPIQITTSQALEEQDREFTRNMTFDQRMEYLQKLISITHSEEDLMELERKFYNSKIIINKSK